MSKEAANKAIVGRWFTTFWGKTCDLTIVDELAAPDMLLQYSLHAPRRGRDDIKAFMTAFRAAFPDLHFWGTADLIAGNGPQRGYFVNKHSDGNRDFGTFEGRIATSGGQVTIEGTWKFTGGTGKLQGLTGGGSYKGRMTSPVEVENTWDGKYLLAAKIQAA